MKAWIKRIISIVVMIALFLSLQRLVQPKYAESLPEGSYTAAYYKETLGHQVLMVGDCELYENFDPVTMWENYGITSYIRGNAQQLAWQSYYLLKEALKTETPEVVVFNVFELKYNEPQKEEYNRLTLDHMKWSADKVAAIYASMTEDETFWDYLFPILRYHTRITELTEEDFTYYASSKQNSVAGYYMRTDVEPYVIGEWGEENDVGAYTAAYMEQAAAQAGAGDDAEEDDGDDEWTADGDDEDDEWTADGDDEDDEWTADGDDEDDEWTADGDDADDDDEWSEDEDDAEEDDVILDADWTPANGREDVDPLGDNAMHYLDLIRELCEEKGITLLLVKAPSVAPVWYDKWDEQIVEYADTYGLDYVNYLPLVDEIGIDFSEDTYDGGLHLNYSGAVKCADYLGAYLVEHYGLQDNRSDAKISAVWEEKIEQQKKMIEEQP
jgi:hypothetical protein